MRLSDLEADAELDVPREVGHVVKTLATDPRYALAWRFILDQLCGIHRLSFVPGRPDTRETMCWLEGRRYVGEQLRRMVDSPITDAEPVLKPAQTITEKVSRREATQANE